MPPYDDYSLPYGTTGYLQPAGPGIFGGLFNGGQQRPVPGLLSGGNTDALMEQLIRRQLERSMSPDFGAFAAALGRAAQPSLLPKSVGAALAEASGALSGSGDANELKALQGLKLLQDMKNARAEQAMRGQVLGMTQKGLDIVRGYTSGGSTSSSGTGTAGSLVPGGAATGESKGGGLGYGQLTQLALDAGFPAEDAPIMAAISMGESSGNPNAKNITDRERSYGITQINALAHPGGEQALGNPEWAMQKAKELYDARRARGQRGFEDWSVYTNGTYRQHLQGAQAATPTPYDTDARVKLPEVPSYGSTLAAAPSPGVVASASSAAPAEAPDWAVGPPLPSLGPAQTQQQQFAAGRAPQLPPGTRFNRRGEALSPDLSRTLEGQQSGPDISAEMLRGFAQANAGRSGGGIPAAVVEDPGGGGDDGGGLVAGGGARPPVPGIFGPQAAAPAQPPVPGVLAPPAAAAPPMAPGAVPALPNIPSQIPKPPPLPDTRETQRVLAEIAAMRAQTQALKLGDPFGPLHDAIVQSPRFKAEQEAVAKAAAHPYELDLIRQRTEEAVRQGRMLHPLEIDKILQQGEQQRQTALAGMGLRRNPQTGEVERDPGFASAKAETEGLAADTKARLEAAQRKVEVQVGKFKYDMTAEQAQKYYRGEAVPEFNIPADPSRATGAAPAPGAAATGPRGGTRVYTPDEEAARKELGTGGAKAIQDTQAHAEAAMRRIQTYGQMAEAMEGFKPGASAETQLRTNQIFKDVFGVEVFGPGKTVPSAETFQRAARSLQLSSAPKGQGQVSNYERELFASAVMKMSDSPEGLMKAINIARRLDEYDMKVAEIHQKAATDGVPNVLEAYRQIRELGPPLSPGEYAALERIKAGEMPALGKGNRDNTTSSGTKWRRGG